jgi:hypothetical protein
MSFKDSVKKDFTNKDKINKLRYKSSKLIFVLVSLLFFLAFFLYWAGLFQPIIPQIVSILYILLIISLFIFVYFWGISIFKTKINWVYKYILIAILLILLVIFTFPIIVEWWLFWFFNEFITM